MPTKPLILNDKTQLVTQIMSLAYLANQTSEYGITVEYGQHVDQLSVRIYEPDNEEWLYHLEIYIEPSSLEEIQKFKDVLGMFLNGKDIAEFKNLYGYAEFKLWEYGAWDEEGVFDE